MPVACPISFECLDQTEFGARDFALMPHFFASQTEIGRLADESVYEADVAARFVEAGGMVHREVPITISYGTFSKTFYLDLVADGKLIYELKAIAKLTAEHMAQLLNYLLMLDLRHAKLVNMRPASVQASFVNSLRTLTERREFAVDERNWSGGEKIVQFIRDLLQDWGIGLSVSLYHQALVHFLGGEALVVKELAMQRDAIPLGNQRFHLLDETSAFRVTSFDNAAQPYRHQLRRLL